MQKVTALIVELVDQHRRAALAASSITEKIERIYAMSELRRQLSRLARLRSDELSALAAKLAASSVMPVIGPAATAAGR